MSEAWDVCEGTHKDGVAGCVPILVWGVGHEAQGQMVMSPAMGQKRSEWSVSKHLLVAR